MEESKPCNVISLVLTSESNYEKAVELAGIILNKKLAACVSLQETESHYWWQGVLEKNSEVQLLIKTSQNLVAEIYEVICKYHSYSTPEFICLNSYSSKEYVSWMKSVLPKK